MTPGRQRRLSAFALVALGLSAGFLALRLFPRALPSVAIDQRLTQQLALQQADAFFMGHGLAPAALRRAVRFHVDDSLLTFVDFAGGGHDSVSALARGRDVSLFVWSVRAFAAGDPREARVDFAPDGRLLGFRRTLAETDSAPDVGADSARRIAEQLLVTWLEEPLARWRLATSSYDTKKASGRVDRSFTFERADRRIADAPIRLEVVIAGNTPSLARPYVEVPESFRRRYGEMRSANDLLALLATVGILGLVVAGIMVLRTFSRTRAVRWREALMAGGVIGALLLAAGLNEIPGSWFAYDTATSPAVFQATIVAGAILGAAGMALLVGLTLAAAEAATRRAFPAHLDWWAIWKFRGTRAVAGQVGGGYVVAALAFSYVAVFYLLTRSVFGWWVPSELLDDPNQIASPLPWISGIAMSLQAGVWEEALFRALPLSLLSLWVGQRPRRAWWMAAGVAASALVFGFAHANYPSWPAYSRGVEIFLDACLWGALFLRFGLLVTVIAHFVYDLVLFGIFAAAGSAPAYRVTGAIILAALLAPAFAVAWRWVAQHGLRETPPDARFRAWIAPAPSAEEPAVAARRAFALTEWSRRAAIGLAILAIAMALAIPARPVLGPRFTATRSEAIAVADSMLREQGATPEGWRRLAATAQDTLAAWPRFLAEHHAESVAVRASEQHVPPAWWVVRYVHTADVLAARAEEWRVRVRPDGRRLDARHIIPDSAPRPVLAPGDVRRAARAALVRAGLDTIALMEVKFAEAERPSRRDVTVTYTDSSAHLPDGAAAHAWVVLAGNDLLLVRRGVELPEAFLRADRDRETRRQVIAALLATLLAGAVIGGAIYVVKRRPASLPDGMLSTRGMLVLAGGLGALSLVQALDALPDALFQYDTSVPWTNFVSSTAVGLVLALVPAIVATGLWMMLGAMRRRAGIPELPPAGSASRPNDLLLAGFGLGSMFALAGLAGTMMSAAGVPPAPTTVLDRAVPALGDALAMPLSIVMSVAVLAIPALVIVAISRRAGVRALLGLLAVALVGAVALASAPGRPDVSLGGALVGSAVVAGGYAALRWWAPLCAWAWILAALVQRGVAALHLLVNAPTGAERVAALVTMAVAAGLGIVVVRRAARPLLQPDPIRVE